MSQPITDSNARRARLDRVVHDVVAFAIRRIAPRRVWLFGSQAMGTARRASDVDLAFEVTKLAPGQWSSFATEVEEHVSALVELDLVDLETCPPALAAEITATGRVVYERDRLT